MTTAIPGMRRISSHTGGNRLRSEGFRARRPVRGVVLADLHRRLRRQCYQGHRV